MAHIRWFVQHQPDHEVCRSPLTQPHPRRHPVAYAAIVEEWRRALETHPDNHLVTRGAALLFALDRPEDGRALLVRALQSSPDDPELWRDLGRLHQEPAPRLAAFLRARTLGSTSAEPAGADRAHRRDGWRT